MPAAVVGERRQRKDGQWVEWDGQGWLPAKPPEQGILSSLRAIASPEGMATLEKYITGRGDLKQNAKDAIEFGKEELKGFGSALNPINIGTGLVNLGLHPINSLDAMGEGLYNAATGDPQAIGGLLGTAVAPKVYGAGLRAVNKGATALAESPAAQRSAGYIGGAGAGIAAGAHPFLMGRIGQAVAPVIGAGARGVANMTGRVMDAVGMDRPAPTLTDAERATAGTIGNAPVPPTEATVLPNAPDAWDRAASGVKGTYTRLPNGEWGIRPKPGHTLIPGESVEVLSKNGVGRMHTIGAVTPDGLATISGKAPQPSTVMLDGKAIDVSTMADHVRNQLMDMMKKEQP